MNTTVTARLTPAEREQVAKAAKASHKTVSQWVKNIVLASLAQPGETTELEDLFGFCAVQFSGMKLMMEEWQHGGDLRDDPEVQNRIAAKARALAEKACKLYRQDDSC
jgi:hypothetical protein